ncbi:hypothetical protein GCM10011344_26630 [Dokdonia pacifica]|uniref:Uncharacterized protein n=1 Tax=Dokdonia pacifica TaxID=1627892 RepID=A0A239E0N9_9FLAO|nr:hypothetical protein [Dokdonia pacifica]GGG24632.1 hypothetical protein GCM10011344_26630 [Dokdonia pacifica]SNS38069.1 hypothetical protein SAMN06265376_11333 [Dokdonia pacifica]
MRAIISKEFIPLALCIALLLLSEIKGVGFTYNFSEKYDIGFLFILISAISFFLHRKTYLILFTITLFLGSLNFINIFYNTYTFGIADIIHFNLIFIGIFILFFVTNKKSMNTIFPK